ncbi:MAG TPA: hypothetical protein PKZ08_13340 [Vicinamibacterales bacterium]|nr:hypothetical protein [Vicinamibacterales bacterium]
MAAHRGRRGLDREAAHEKAPGPGVPGRVVPKACTCASPPVLLTAAKAERNRVGDERAAHGFPRPHISALPVCLGGPALPPDGGLPAGEPASSIGCAGHGRETPGPGPAIAVVSGRLATFTAAGPLGMV